MNTPSPCNECIHCTWDMTKEDDPYTYTPTWCKLGEAGFDYTLCRWGDKDCPSYEYWAKEENEMAQFCTHDNPNYCENIGKGYEEHIKELQAQVDELEAECARKIKVMDEFVAQSAKDRAIKRGEAAERRLELISKVIELLTEE